MGNLKEVIKLDKGFAEIRKIVAQSISPFGRTTAKQRRERKARAEASLRAFAETYFPHYCTKPFSKMHADMFERYQRAIDDALAAGDGSKLAHAAPRGNAKSTITTLILPLWCIVARKRRFGVIVSDTTDQANEFLEFVKTELEVNERLREDFPDVCGEGSKWAIGHIVTRNGVKFRCFGARKRMRGVRHGAQRPDLVIGDDLENDENVETHEQRNKSRNWFFKALMKIGARGTVFVIVGTLLHYASLLADLLKQPGWKSRKHQAVIRWSDAPKLWEQWERLYVTEGEDAASAFYEAHREEMLAGTEVLWPEEEDYLYLMTMRLTDGPAYFDSEKQNEPINPDECLFNEDWFVYIDDEEILQRLQRGEYKIKVGACDPSMGKRKKTNDPCAIVVLGVLPDGRIDVLEADIARRVPDRIIDRIIDIHAQYGLRLMGVEEVQFQEFFKDEIIKRAARRGVYVPVQGVRPNTDKALRIEKLQPHIRNALIRFRRSQRTLLDQLKYFPKADHDDGPDALEMAFNLVRQASWTPRFARVG